MIEVNEILQTMQMIHEQHFDIRTITMGISLLDCKKNTDAETAECVFEKVTRCAGRLVAVGEELEAELGVPIVNKRISVTPVSMICGSDPFVIGQALDKAAKTVGVNFIGGCGALLSKCIKKSEVVAYEDLGAEAIRRLEVENFPVVVVIDSLGNNLYEMGREAYLSRQHPEKR